MSSPPVFLGVQHTWGPLPAGAGILGKTTAPARAVGLRVPHAAGTRTHGSQAPTTGLAWGCGLDTRGLVHGLAMRRCGEGHSRQREWQRQRPLRCPSLQIRQQRPGDMGNLVSCSCLLDPVGPEIPLPGSSPLLPRTPRQPHITQ